MAKANSKRSKKAGLPPGTLMYLGEKKGEPVRITLIDYDQDSFREENVDQIEKCFDLKNTQTVTWINIDGIHDTDLVEKIGNNFDLHSLVLEDIVGAGQRPKLEEFEGYTYIVFKMLTYNEKTASVESEQVSLVLSKHFVISFQEHVGDVFEVIRERLRSAKGRIRKMGCDYLSYSLIDAVVDNYFSVLEKLGEQIEEIEEVLIANPDDKTVKEIHVLKREMLYLRKSVWPLREVVNNLQKTESGLVSSCDGSIFSGCL